MIDTDLQHHADALGGVPGATSPGLTWRRPEESDHARVLAVLDRWWAGFGGTAGSLERSLLLPRLYFQHFSGTSWLVEQDDGTPAAFLIGFLSPDHPEVGYIHFVGVDPRHHRAGLGAQLYRRFFRDAAGAGAHRVSCITSPGNAGSIAFHRRLGFDVLPGASRSHGVSVHPDYDGPGLDRVLFSRALE